MNRPTRQLSSLSRLPDRLVRDYPLRYTLPNPGAFVTRFFGVLVDTSTLSSELCLPCSGILPDRGHKRKQKADSTPIEVSPMKPIDHMLTRARALLYSAPNWTFPFTCGQVAQQQQIMVLLAGIYYPEGYNVLARVKQSLE